MTQTVMIIRHPAVTSAVFKLVSTVEFDLEIDGHFLPSRIEVFQDTERDRVFRCRLWERDLFQMQPVAQQEAGDRQETPEVTAEEVMVERTWELSDGFESFEADTPAKALQIFIEAIETYLRRALTGNGGSGR